MGHPINPEKARQAARRPERSAERCQHEPGARLPLVNRAKCEGKSDCVEVCPYGVFEVRRMEAADFAALGVLGKLKSLAHRRRTAYTPRADDCHGCGLCVAACPEKAITLAVRSPAPA